MKKSSVGFVDSGLVVMSLFLGGIIPFLFSAIQLFHIALIYEAGKPWGGQTFWVNIVIACVITQPFFIFSFYELFKLGTDNRYARPLLSVMLAGGVGIKQFILIAQLSLIGLMAIGVPP